MLAGYVLVHGLIMARGRVGSMHVTVMRQQSKREWYDDFVCSVFPLTVNLSSLDICSIDAVIAWTTHWTVDFPV